MNNETEPRERTFEWADPMLGATSAMKMSGYEYIKSICDGTLPMPPIMSLLGVDTASMKEGYMDLEFYAKEYHYNTIGGVHGGVFCTLLDSCMGCAVHTTLAQGTGFATLEFKVNFLKPIKIESGKMTCEGTVIHSGKKTAVAEAKILDESGKLYALGQSTCLIL